MPIIRGTYPGTIKTFSYTHYVTTDGGVLCDQCISEEDEPEASPIFADQEWTYYPECDACSAEADYVTLLQDEE